MIKNPIGHANHIRWTGYKYNSQVQRTPGSRHKSGLLPDPAPAVNLQSVSAVALHLCGVCIAQSQNVLCNAQITSSLGCARRVPNRAVLDVRVSSQPPCANCAYGVEAQSERADRVVMCSTPNAQSRSTSKEMRLLSSPASLSPLPSHRRLAGFARGDARHAESGIPTFGRLVASHNRAAFLRTSLRNGASGAWLPALRAALRSARASLLGNIAPGLRASRCRSR